MNLSEYYMSIYDKENVIKHFDEHINIPITLYVPASGSWCETFYTKEQYIKRMDEWEKALRGEPNNWYESRGSTI